MIGFFISFNLSSELNFTDEISEQIGFLQFIFFPLSKGITIPDYKSNHFHLFLINIATPSETINNISYVCQRSCPIRQKKCRKGTPLNNSYRVSKKDHSKNKCMKNL